MILQHLLSFSEINTTWSVLALILFIQQVLPWGPPLRVGYLRVRTPSELAQVTHRHTPRCCREGAQQPRSGLAALFPCWLTLPDAVLRPSDSRSLASLLTNSYSSSSLCCFRTAVIFK